MKPVKKSGVSPDASKIHYTAAVSLAEQCTTSTVEVLRVGTIRDRGLVITEKMLQEFVQNFKNDVYGTEVQVNLNHDRGNEAAGWVKNLFINGESLMAEVEWTELGVEKLHKKLFKFVSSEFSPQYAHADTGKPVSNVFTGLALTNTPALKRQLPIALSEHEAQFIHNLLMFNEYIKNLKARAKLSADDVSCARTLLSEVPAEEQETAKAEVDALDTKQKEQEAADKTAADAAAAVEADKAKAAEALKEKDGTVSLSEYKKLEESHKQLSEKVELQNLTEEVTKSLTLSEERGTGVLPANVPAVVSFMHTLNADQRTQFTKIVSEIKSVDFSTIGAGASETVALSGDDEDKAVQLAEKFMKEDANLSVADAQKKAVAELAKSKK